MGEIQPFWVEFAQKRGFWMHAPRGFGKNYFSLVAIQAYASEVRLLKNITRIELIVPICPIYIYSSISPPNE